MLSRSFVLIFGLALTATASAWETKSHDDPYGKALSGTASGDLHLGDAVHYGGVTLYPVVRDNSQKTAQNWLTFEEAMVSQAIWVGESKDGGTVSSVQVVNRSATPVFMQGGEIIRGGNQDRVLTQDAIIRPHSSTLVAVNCVEKNRWGSAGTAFGYGGHAESGLRRVLLRQNNQEATWDAVAALNARNGSLAQRKGNIGPTHYVNGSSYNSQKNLLASQSSKYIAELMPNLQKQHDVVGVVVAVGDRIIASDVYADPQLFAKLREDTVESYVLDALMLGGVQQFRLPPSTNDATWFLRDALASVEIDEDPGVGGWNEELDGAVSRSYVFRAGHNGDMVHMTSYLD